MSRYYLGIDVSKGYADFVLLDSEKSLVDERFQLDDTYAGHQGLNSYLEALIKQHPNTTVYAGVESTGGYENNWYYMLCSLTSSLPVHVVRLNPARVKANHDARAKRNKTDPISASDIAEYLITHPDRVTYDQQDCFPTLRKQWNYIQLNIKQKGQLLSHLESLLYSSMPELLSFCKNGTPTWLLMLLKAYPTYQKIRRAGARRLSGIPYVSINKAEKILALIKNGIGNSDPISAQIIRSISIQILNLDQQITQQKKYLENNYDEAKDLVDLLNTFKGIGIYSAIGLLLNIVSVHRFINVKKLAAYFGLHPVYKISGDGSSGFRMSKQGRSEPRAILYMVAWSATQYNPVIKNVYTRSLAKGMAPNQALGVCMHKILRIVYGMLKNNQPFNPETDLQYQQRNKNENQEPKSNKKRRLQQFDSTAPISRRQNKHRKEQVQSQDDNIAKCGILDTAPSSEENNLL